VFKLDRSDGNQAPSRAAPVALATVFFVLIEHEFESREYCTVRTIIVKYWVHGGVTSEGTKCDRGGHLQWTADVMMGGEKPGLKRWGGQ